MAKLVLLSEGLTGRSYELKVDRTTIGRVDDNAFPIVEASVSSHHCELLLRGSDVIVKDLKSLDCTVQVPSWSRVPPLTVQPEGTPAMVNVTRAPFVADGVCSPKFIGSPAMPAGARGASKKAFALKAPWTLVSWICMSALPMGFAEPVVFT